MAKAMGCFSKFMPVLLQIISSKYICVQQYYLLLPSLLIFLFLRIEIECFQLNLTSRQNVAKRL